MVLFPPQPAEPVSAGFNEESMEPVDIVVSDIIIIIKGNLCSHALLDSFALYYHLFIFSHASLS